MIIGTATVTKSEIYVKLSQKYAELYSYDQKQELKEVQNRPKDYFEISNNNNFDKNDYERVLDKFKKIDSNIRAHEQTHASLANTTTPISYTYQMGPDGKMYATGGNVRLDVSIPNDPKAAMAKLDKIQKSAVANSDMSGADATISIGANLMKMRLSIENN